MPTPNAGPVAIAIDADGTVKDAYLPIDVGRPDYLVAGPNDTLVVIAYTKGIFGISQSWTIARIREATAMR